ncbi:hypothetical protein HYDPIDRAFT_41880 [Hydnomerulius pinastri MD-312]|uniref:G domain-containing protein n=1 Tax=Hydnomerulius pinastri MD-312 TaxID=994086 RepID=A0A0C9WCR5_9AGAM|nr:hypothetical protein HYDPIDRAFT_41880 [Hydnomerulius pinastri MD-312]
MSDACPLLGGRSCLQNELQMKFSCRKLAVSSDSGSGSEVARQHLVLFEEASLFQDIRDPSLRSTEMLPTASLLTAFEGPKPEDLNLPLQLEVKQELDHDHNDESEDDSSGVEDHSPTSVEEDVRVEDRVFPFIHDGIQQLRGRFTMIETEGIALSDRTTRTMDELASRLPASRRVAVVGRSGSGKSTVLNALLGCQLLLTSACLSALYDRHKVILKSMHVLAHADTLLHDPIVSAKQLAERFYSRARGTDTGGVQLQNFVSSHDLEDDDNAIFGPFQVLSTGTVLVDVPGYGDSNIFRYSASSQLPSHLNDRAPRAQRAKKSMESADSVMLVCDVKRVVDDQGVREHLEERIKAMTAMDGRRVTNGDLLAVVTGNDIPILENEARLGKKGRSMLMEYKIKIRELEEQKKVTKSKMKTAISKPKHTAQPEVVNQLSKTVNRIRNAIAKQKADRTCFLARARALRVRDGVQQLYKKCFLDVSRNKSLEPSPLQTGIPQLSEFLHRNNGREVLLDTRATLVSARYLCLDLEDCLRQSSSNPDFEYVDFLDASNRVLCDAETEALEAISRNMIAINNHQQDLVNGLSGHSTKCASESLNVLEMWRTMVPRWNSYRSSMRYEGHYYGLDLNEMLTKEMVSDDALNSWNQAMNIDIPYCAKIMTKEICAVVRSAKQQIVSSAPHPHQAQIELACERIDEWELTKTARSAYLEKRTDLQRQFGGSFAQMLQEKLRGHYEMVAAEKGIGMFARMQGANYERLKNAASLFESIIDSISDSFIEVDEKGYEDLEVVITTMFRHLRNSVQMDDAEDSAVSALLRHIRAWEKAIQDHINIILIIIMSNSFLSKLHHPAKPIKVASGTMGDSGSYVLSLGWYTERICAPPPQSTL